MGRWRWACGGEGDVYAEPSANQPGKAPANTTNTTSIIFHHSPRPCGRGPNDPMAAAAATVRSPWRLLSRLPLPADPGLDSGLEPSRLSCARGRNGGVGARVREREGKSTVGTDGGGEEHCGD
jgi:hypothetical protein